jgi:hypothetical protein
MMAQLVSASGDAAISAGGGGGIMKIGVPTWTAWTGLAGSLVGAIWGIAIIAPHSTGHCTTTVVNGVTTLTGGGTCSVSSTSGSLVGAIVFVAANSLLVTLIFLAAGLAARFIGKRRRRPPFGREA